MKREAHVKDAVKRLCKKYDAYYAMPHQAGYGVPGVPDFLICCNGVFLGVETKFGHNKPTAHQQRQLHQIEAANGWAMVIHEKNLDELEHVLASC